MVRRITCMLLLVGTVLPSMAQTGPAGVGDNANNVLWLSADHGTFSNAGSTPATNGQNVRQWNDRSGNGRHAAQSTSANRPNWHSNQLNGYPVMRFTAANNDRMASLGLATGNRASVWIVARHNGLPSSNPGLLQGAAAGNAYANPPGDKNIGMWVSSATSQVWGRGIQGDGTQRNVTMATALSNGQAYVINTMYRPASIDQYVDNGTAGSVTSNGTLRSWTDVAIGCQAGSESWNGDIAEVLVFNEAVNDAQRIIVSNYLSAKYGLSLAANDVYREDNPARGNYDHDVAGIGRINGANQHTDARGSGMVRISNPTDLNNNEFLMWGHDNGQLGAWGVSDLPDGVQGRLERVWRVSERNTTGTTAVDVGAVDITFDLSGMGNVEPEHLRLMVDANNDGVFASGSVSAGAEHVGGSLYRFNGVTALVDGARFTLGTSNMSITPLPIELVSFSARQAGQGQVSLAWATAAEWDNAFFDVERSTDLTSWTHVVREDAVGHSLALVEYDALDLQPEPGINYYRLRQTDLDGTNTLSHVVAVDMGLPSGIELELYPNPAQGHVFLRAKADATCTTAVHDDTGRIVHQANLRFQPGEAVPLALDHLAAGNYVVRVQCDGSTDAIRLILVR